MSNWRHTTEYRKWRAGVIRRDTYCQTCGTIKNRHAHHLNHATYFPEQRFDVENGVTLCRKCHMMIHCKKVGSYRKKCTEDDYIDFKYIVDEITRRCCKKKDIKFLTDKLLESDRE